MKIKLYQIDAFTNRLFGGNPAAVCPLKEWPSDELLQNIAIENNLAETAFFIPLDAQRFHLRWFTPEFEMDLCGHATLATAFVIFNEFDYPFQEIYFESNSGLLTVQKEKHLLALDFPSRPPLRSELPKIIQDALSIKPKEVWKARDYLLLYEKEESIRSLEVNQHILNQINLDPGGVMLTARGEQVDFVSRFFTPGASVFEDPVTGSAHCTLIPFWAERLQKKSLHALQVSARGGELFCELNQDRVKIRGEAVKFLEGTIDLPD